MAGEAPGILPLPPLSPTKLLTFVILVVMVENKRLPIGQNIGFVWDMFWASIDSPITTTLKDT